MKDHSLVPSECLYKTLIAGYIAKGNRDRALFLYNEMVSKGLRPNCPYFFYDGEKNKKKGRLEDLQSFLVNVKSTDGCNKSLNSNIPSSQQWTSASGGAVHQQYGHNQQQHQNQQQQSGSWRWRSADPITQVETVRSPTSSSSAGGGGGHDRGRSGQPATTPAPKVQYQTPSSSAGM
ncbi:hypothetical protein FEM48_ZijujUnG0089300 [Ziziphus jujuba var. spinosa]|uniref:Pentatricopeptide repeat-containing protein n=1 Tax=Ziziphus jujuba var. spinosa TaxID=714518 RepID=A0A978U8J6_ZIZJJ|nr:hypothetical protein FEM48_ZijujUnG0089300 [Ziziphus jujuba var. spinosa]